LTELDPETVDPMELFQSWFEEALESSNPEPTSMTLATVDPDGRPTARIVLLKGVNGEEFRFFTNYESRKGEELAGVPWVALVFFWKELGYQVRVRGHAEKLTREESDRYFESRPRGSRIGAWASDQSRPVSDRSELVERQSAVEERFAGSEVERPPHWGGFRVRPDEIEFWQEGEFRLHDRIRFARHGDGWETVRLFP